MMNYEIFKEVFKGKLTDYMPDEFKNYKAVEHKVYKVNCEKDAINLFPTGENSILLNSDAMESNVYFTNSNS